MKKIIVTTYYSQEMGDKVIEELMEYRILRENIGYAIEKDVPENETERVMVTAVVEEDQFDEIHTVMNSFKPIKIEERDYQWLKGNVDDVEFDTENFAPIDKIETE